jgi:hypothetical protein
MSPLERIGAIRGGRLTLGACMALAAGAVGIGLAIMAVLPPEPPDAAFAARTQAWRVIGPTPR